MKYLFSLSSSNKRLQSILPLLFALLSFATSANEFSLNSSKSVTAPETIAQKVLVQSPDNFDGDDTELDVVILWSSISSPQIKNVVQKIIGTNPHFSSVYSQGFLARAPPF